MLKKYSQEIQHVQCKKSLAGKPSLEDPWKEYHHPTVHGGRSKILEWNGLPINPVQILSSRIDSDDLRLRGSSTSPDFSL